MSSSQQPDSRDSAAGRGASIGPLRGVRVLDLTRFPPGGYCTVGLADLGADVIRVESPKAAGQPSRVVGQLALSRGKRSATINMRHERGNEVLSRLAGSADVLVENDSPGVMESRGFGYPQASAAHPRLIWCSITGFGQDGPYASWPGHDLTYTAHSGLLGALSPELPWHPATMLSVPIGAMFATTGILAALRERDATGHGCQIDISLADAATWLTSGMDGAFAETNPMSIPVDPTRRLYECGDGKWLSVAAAEPRTWGALCGGLGVPELAENGTPATADDRDAATRKLAEIFAAKPAGEWIASLGPMGAAVGPVNVLDDVVRDPHNQARGVTVEVGGVRVPANPIRLRNEKGALTGTATAEPGQVGEHTDDVLAEAGYSAEEIAGLRADGVV